MLTPMDVQTAASGPALPLGIAVAVAVLALALAAALVISWRRPAREHTFLPRLAAPGSYPDDDLPSFRDHPPGFPGARPVPAGVPARAAGPAGVAERNPVRALTVMALAALLLIGAAAAVAATAAATDRAPATVSPGRPTGTAAPAPAPPMSVPETPAAGSPGAGRLADASVPVEAGGLAARGTFGGVVLEQRAVGITVTYPSVSVAVADAATALAHVRLPTWNCMTDRPPADPAVAACRASVPEYADLPAPALQVTRAGDGVRLHGRFPTYVRPAGGEPVYTGRVYELAVTLHPGQELSDRWTAASGELSLGRARAESVADGRATTMRSGG
jgi:hypothetical protein